MKNFLAVYNMSRPTGFTPEVPTIAEFMQNDNFVTVGYFPAKDVNDAFRILNTDHPLEVLMEVEKCVNKFDYVHSSMSVGDVLIETSVTGWVHYMCMPIGWVVLKNEVA